MLGGTGVGFRSELAAELVAQRALVDFVEVVAESCFTQRHARREAIALADLWPVVPHGVKLSLGSAEGVDLDRARRLGALARELRAPAISEHVAFTRAGGTEIGHLTQLPRTRAAIAAVARNVAAVRRVLPDIPLLLENVAWAVLWPGDEMDEATFYNEIVKATGCDLLLDAGNLYANAVNEGRDPLAVLRAYPLERVAMIHVAGGTTEDGFYFDTHAHPIPAAVMRLVAHVLRERDVPVMIERDADFEVPAIVAELAALRALPRGGRTAGSARSGEAGALDPVLAAQQAELASRLVTDPAGEVAFDAIALARARGILHRKRFDDALPLLGYLARTSERVRAIADDALAVQRAPVRAAPNDAWRIAERALSVPELAEAAALDRLVLRARFTGADRRPRRGPFVGFARLADGRRVRATKGFGALAEVMLHHHRR